MRTPTKPIVFNELPANTTKTAKQKKCVFVEVNSFLKAKESKISDYSNGRHYILFHAYTVQ